MGDGETYHRQTRPQPGSTLVSRTAETVTAWMERYAWFLLLLLLLITCLHLVWSNAAKWVWFDELFTWNLTEQQHWRQYWYGLPADANPPLGSMLAWVTTHLFGRSPLTVRLPSLLAFMGTTVLLYRIVSIRLGNLAGLAAAALFNLNGQVDVYAIEARPYALVLLFTTAAFASWQLATDAARPRPWARWAIAVCIAGAILSHHYGVLSAGLPLVFGEAARSLQRRRVDWKLAAIAATGLAALILTRPLMLGVQRMWLQYALYPHVFPRSLRGSSYLALFSSQQRRLIGLLLVLLLCQTAWLSWQAGKVRIRKVRRQWPRYELVGLAGSAATLAIVYTIALKTSGYFGGFRYGIGAYFGVVALTATLFAVLERKLQALVLVVMAWPIVHAIPLHRMQAPAETPENACIRALPAGPIVLAQALDYPSAWHYADAATRARLFYLTDETYAKRQTYNTPEVVMIVQKPIFPMELVDYHQFLHSHPDFVLLASGIPVQDYPVEHLKQDGYALAPLDVSACARPLQAYRVSRP